MEPVRIPQRPASNPTVIAKRFPLAPLQLCRVLELVPPLHFCSRFTAKSTSVSLDLHQSNLDRVVPGRPGCPSLFPFSLSVSLSFFPRKLRLRLSYERFGTYVTVCHSQSNSCFGVFDQVRALLKLAFLRVATLLSRRAAGNVGLRGRTDQALYSALLAHGEAWVRSLCRGGKEGSQVDCKRDAWECVEEQRRKGVARTGYVEICGRIRLTRPSPGLVALFKE